MLRRSLSSRKRSGGFVLLLLLALVTMGSLYFLVNNLTPEAVAARRQQQTSDALNQAREALIGYALMRRDRLTSSNPTAMYGLLPMPDVGKSRFNSGQQSASCNTEGCAMDFMNGAFPAQDASIVGRLPWRSLGIGPLRDGYGECLWYVVSAHHKDLGIDAAISVNWDTLGHFDIVVADGTNTLKSILSTNTHDRPIAIIFSPGPPLTGQDRSTSTTDVVTECGGNYDAKNYLDPYTSTDLGGATNYLSGTNSASVSTGDSDASNDPDTPKSVLLNGALYKSNSTYLAGGCQGSDCNLVGNDTGLPLTTDALFTAIRKNSSFRTDINSMLLRMKACLRDSVVAGGSVAAGRIVANTSCYGDSLDPQGYFSHYQELTFTGVGTAGVNGQSCAGALVFAGQRSSAQLRDSAAHRNDFSNYLEEPNLSGVQGTGTTYSGADSLERVSTSQTASQDIVQCIPSTASLSSVQSTNLTSLGIGQLTTYTASSRALSLGLIHTTTYVSGAASNLFGCAWQPETHATGSGLRSYFKFRINDVGGSSAPVEGFTFAIVDGDANGVGACGGAHQHLGYSGNNSVTPYLVAPKIGIEIDPRRNANFTLTSSANVLSNGRNDPNYTGGHMGIVYWGGESNIASGSSPCSSPRITVSGTCYLLPEQDDNAHNRSGTRSGFPAPPGNAAAPGSVTSGSEVYKLDANLSSVPSNQDIHMRVEVSRRSASYSLPSVRLASTANLSLAAPGTSVDGVRLFAGDRILLKDQSTAAENGVYVWNSSSTALTRADDADSATELVGAVVQVGQGVQNARKLYRQSATNPTLGSSSLYWANTQVRLAAQSNISLTSPGATIDYLLMQSGDRLLLRTQTTSSENGIYVWNGATSALTRATDADTSAELNGIAVQVQAGTEATAWYRYDGSSWTRHSVRVATQGNIDLTAPGAAIDGVSLTSGNLVLVRAQTAAATNGVYVWNGASSAMTRATTMDSASELAGAITQVLEGSDTGRSYRQTAMTAAGTLGSDSIAWSALDNSPTFVVEAWLLADSVTDANQIAAMKNTTRSMSQLYPSFSAHLHSQATIGYPFRNARIGFTTGQSRNATDQNVTISDFATSWIE